MPSPRTAFRIDADDLEIQVWRMSSPSRYHRVNEAHAAFLGRTPRELAGKSLEEAVPRRDLAKWLGENEEAFERGVGFTSEIEVHDARGRAAVLLVTRSPRLDPDGRVNHLLCHAVDVTAERESRRHLDEASRAALVASVAKRNFLANMSHEIRTPLNGVIGVVEILSTLPASEEQARYLSILSTEARNILELVNGILDFSKIEAGRMEIERVPLSIADLARSLVETMSVAAARAGLDLQLDLDPRLPDQVLGDPTRLRQVLTNLLGNSLKFTKRGYVRLTIRRAGRRIRFVVADTGVGIPKERHEAVFREFEQVDGSTTRNYGGTGLGGTIARDLVRLMGSEIELSSEVGVGTVISFDLLLPTARRRTPPAKGVPQPEPSWLDAGIGAEGEEERRAFALDLTELTGRLGDPALARAVLAEFVSRLPSLLGRIEAALAAQMHLDAAACARDLAHGAADISARPLSERARALEAAALGETKEDAKALFAGVSEEFRLLREAASRV